MSMLQQASAFLTGLLNEAQPRNCYWYGAVLVEVDGRARLLPPGNNPCHCDPVLAPPVAVGWENRGLGSPLIGFAGEDRSPIAFTDCSGFISWLLRGQNPDAYASIPAQLAAIADPALKGYLAIIDRQHGQPWPSAADFAVLGLHDAQAKLPLEPLGGNAALNLAALQPGDILAWGLPPKDTDTGHVVLVQAPPVESKEQVGTWSVEVIDASRIPHAGDHRPGKTGVGSGTITLQQVDLPSNWSVRFKPEDPPSNPQYIAALRIAC